MQWWWAINPAPTLNEVQIEKDPVERPEQQNQVPSDDVHINQSESLEFRERD